MTNLTALSLVSPQKRRVRTMGLKKLTPSKMGQQNPVVIVMASWYGWAENAVALAGSQVQVLARR